MPNHYELALMSERVYAADAKAPENWDVQSEVHIESGPLRGFKAIAYANNQWNRELVIAFRGTDVSGKDTAENIKHDFQLMAASAPSTFNEAKRFYQSVIKQQKCSMYGTQVTFTGHSLGAVFAELMAVYYKMPAVTFESPGSKPIMQKLASSEAKFSNFNKADIITYLCAPNLINTYNEHVGEIRRLYVSYTKSTAIEYLQTVEQIIYVIAKLNPFIKVLVEQMISPAEQKGRFSSLFGASCASLGFNYPNLSANIKKSLDALIAKGGMLYTIASPICKKLFKLGQYTASQHSINAIVKEFDNDEKFPVIWGRVKSWPTFQTMQAKVIGAFIEDKREEVVITIPEEKRTDGHLKAPNENLALLKAKPNFTSLDIAVEQAVTETIPGYYAEIREDQPQPSVKQQSTCLIL